MTLQFNPNLSLRNTRDLEDLQQNKYGQDSLALIREGFGTIAQSRKNSQDEKRQAMLDSYIKQENDRKTEEYNRLNKPQGQLPGWGGGQPTQYQDQGIPASPQNPLYNAPTTNQEPQESPLVSAWKQQYSNQPPELRSAYANPNLSRRDVGEIADRYKTGLDYQKTQSEIFKNNNPASYVIPGYDQATGMPNGQFTPLPAGTKPASFPPRPPAPKPNPQDAVNAGRDSVSSILGTLKSHYETLKNSGQAVSTDQGSIQNITNKIAATGPGQAAGKLFGTERQSTINKIESIRPLLINAIRKASNMGAKGLDSEKELEFYLKAATTPGNDVQSNYEAIKVLDKAYGLGLGTDGGGSNTEGLETKTASDGNVYVKRNGRWEHQ